MCLPHLLGALGCWGTLAALKSLTLDQIRIASWCHFGRHTVQHLLRLSWLCRNCRHSGPSSRRHACSVCKCRACRAQCQGLAKFMRTYAWQRETCRVALFLGPQKACSAVLHHASADQDDNAHGLCMLSSISVSVITDMRATGVPASGLEKTLNHCCVGCAGSACLVCSAKRPVCHSMCA